VVALGLHRSRWRSLFGPGPAAHPG
jgi:hypothetical protein